MFKFSKRTAAPAAPEFEHSVMSNAANSSQAANDIQRELIRVAFQDTVRATGVPPQWLDCAVRYIKTGKHEERVQIQIVMKQWSGHLLRYSLAFQNELMHCLDRYEPGVDHSQHEWLWRYAVDCESPFPGMPPPEMWTQKQNPVRADAPPPRTTSPTTAHIAAHLAKIPAAAAVAPVSAAVRAGKDFELRDIFSDLRSDTLHASGSTPLSAS